MTTVTAHISGKQWAVVQWKALVVAAIGAAIMALGLLLSPEHFFRAYLVAFNFWLGIALVFLKMRDIQ